MLLNSFEDNDVVIPIYRVGRAWTILKKEIVKNFKGGSLSVSLLIACSWYW
ncbi:MAG: hypothetical protein R2764_05500 [Bacteroidales bacterium]